jgi:hypothetical protein
MIPNKSFDLPSFISMLTYQFAHQSAQTSDAVPRWCVTGKTIS